MSFISRLLVAAPPAVLLFNAPVHAVPVSQSTAITDVSGMTVTGTGSTVARAADEINALDYATFQAAATQAASAGKVLRLPPGTYSYTSGTTLTVSAPVIFEPGAVLACSGSNVTFSNSVTAPRNQIFASGCAPSFWGDKRQSEVFPEWWGAAGDSACTTGSGTDNTTPFSNAIASGASKIALGGATNYRFTSLSTTRSNLAFVGVDRGSSRMCQDDATGLLDGIAFSGNGGQNTVKDINFSRIQAGVGSVASATVVTGGSGYAIGDTVTLSGGTYATPATFTLDALQVTGATVASGGSGGTNGTATVTGTTGAGTKFQASVTISGGAITAVNSITLGGIYTTAPTKLTAEPVTGGGLTGATLSLTMGVGQQLQVLGASVVSGGSGGTNGTATVTGTTGTGTMFQASVTISGGAITSVNSITLRGRYSVAPTTLTAEPVTGGGLTGAVLSLTMIPASQVVTVAGAYTQAAPPTATPTVVPAVPQASTSGSGSGATFKPLWQGPALLAFTQGYFITVEHNTLSGNAWDNIRIEGANSQIYVERNQIFSANHDNIFMPALLKNGPGDVFIEDHNYISQAKYAGIEIVAGPSTGGIFVTQNGIYNNNYGLFWDGSIAAIGSSKIRANDIDSNAAGDFYFALNEVQYQQNWHADVGPFVCTNCANILGEGNLFTAPSQSAAIFNNGAAIHWDNNHYAGGAGGNGMVQVNPYNGANSSGLSFAASSWAYWGGSGYFLKTTGSPSLITVGVQMASSSQGVSDPTNVINNLTITGAPSATNNVNNPASAALYGANNIVGAASASANGNQNTVYGYAATAFGQANFAGGGYSFVHGDHASDDGLTGAHCFASGTTTGNAGGQQICEHVLRTRTTSVTASRLTSDGASAGAANCVNLPSDSHAQFQIMVSGYNPTSGAYADWQSSGPNVMSRPGAASTTTYSGSFTTATAPAVSNGDGSAATLQLAADTTNGCLSVTVTPPDANAWDWEAAIIRLKMQ